MISKVLNCVSIVAQFTTVKTQSELISINSAKTEMGPKAIM